MIVFEAVVTIMRIDHGVVVNQMSVGRAACESDWLEEGRRQFTIPMSKDVGA